MLLPSEVISLFSLFLLLVLRNASPHIDVQLSAFFIRQAVQLKLKHFAVVLGNDIPDYVNDASLLLHCNLSNHLFQNRFLLRRHRLINCRILSSHNSVVNLVLSPLILSEIASLAHVSSCLLLLSLL